jgi:hypothetical protein
MSADGTLIAFEQMGYGEPLIVVGGATCDAARMRPTAEYLARDLAVINYDRRGRGDSGDTLPYVVRDDQPRVVVKARLATTLTEPARVEGEHRIAGIGEALPVVGSVCSLTLDTGPVMTMPGVTSPGTACGGR